MRSCRLARNRRMVSFNEELKVIKYVVVIYHQFHVSFNEELKESRAQKFYKRWRVSFNEELKEFRNL